MKVALVAHYLDKGVGYGISRYAFELLHGLRKKGISASTISCPHKFPSPLKSAFDYYFYLPLLVLFMGGNSRVFHFTMQQAGFAIPLLKLLRRKKVVTTIHDLHPFIQEEKSLPLLKTAIRMSATESDYILADSQQTKDDIIAHFNVPEEKIKVVSLGIDDKFKPMKRPKNKEFTVGYIGGFSEQKDVPYLLRAFSIFEKQSSKPAKLVLYGKGPQYETCLSLAKELGIKKVEFKGFADEKDLVKIYNSFDVFVFPSKMEGFGFPVLEAQKCGVPVVVKEAARISPEITEFCFKSKNEKDLARILSDIVKNGFTYPEEHYNYLDRFTWDTCADETIKIYKKY
ncbi:glycosyltransferase family 4 protein [Candidatus Micrarchaeota archaeon]|nr:glycosyltransferase family 4 protein [Candidatus Micrarchaeota archaeon]MBU1681400.1 glycosyltransferase family 4 protein [Candidatus Micrarchaeota archaeon]